jgi:hypothetical protein
MKHITLDNLFLFLLTVTLLYLTLHIPQIIYRQEDFRHVEQGLPLPFIVQGQRITPPLPWQTSFETPRENPTRIIWHNFFVDVLLVLGLLKFSTRFYYPNKIIKFMQYTLPLGVFLFYLFTFLLIVIGSICCTPKVHLVDPALKDSNIKYNIEQQDNNPSFH